MADHRRLDLLDRHLDLAAARSDSGRRVCRDEADDLLGCPALRSVESGRDLRVQGGGQRPRLRAVNADLDEPQRTRIITQPALGRSGVDVVPGHPLLVGRGVKFADFSQAHRVAYIGDVPGCDPGAFGQVVVVGTRVIGLDVGARSPG